MDYTWINIRMRAMSCAFIAHRSRSVLEQHSRLLFFESPAALRNLRPECRGLTDLCLVHREEDAKANPWEHCCNCFLVSRHT